MGNWKKIVFLDIDGTTNSKQWLMKTIGVTEHFDAGWLCRGNEIEKWLLGNFKGMGTKYGLDDDGFPYYRKHYGDELTDYEYVIFDDDTDFLLGQTNNFIRTDGNTGLTQENIDKARKILMREN